MLPFAQRIFYSLVHVHHSWTVKISCLVFLLDFKNVLLNRIIRQASECVLTVCALCDKE